MPQEKTNKSQKTAKPAEKDVTAQPAQPAKSNGQAITIAVLVTIIVCAVITFGVLIATGVIKFGDSAPTNQPTTGQTGDTTSTTGGIIDNPNSRVKVKDATLAKVQDLEFYLPDDFEAGGKNSNGAYTYNLTDDDGWAQVLVYVEESNLTPEKYLAKISPYLEVTDSNYRMNGTSWVQAENANALAYATELDGTIYAVYYSVKLDSDDTAEAMSMIPKTLYMARIYSK